MVVVVDKIVIFRNNIFIFFAVYLQLVFNYNCIPLGPWYQLYKVQNLKLSF